MSIFRKVALSAAALLSIGAYASEPPVLTVAADRAYIPFGFDDNDVIQVVLQGMYPHTCYRVAGYDRVVDPINKTVKITNRAYHYPGLCLQVLVPYSQVIDLGFLDAGSYSIIDGITNTKLGELLVGLAKNPGPDDFLYAPVQDATVSRDGDKLHITLTGNFTSSCFKFKEIRAGMNNGNVLVVQPIIDVSGSDNCTAGDYQYVQSVDISGTDVKTGRYLLHVRSLNGQSINKLVDL